ncbi:MAG: glycosyltransferase [Planctomycetes bacterium]|nr:glycosyltransferase [Planctomycetota bacterium]
MSLVIPMHQEQEALTDLLPAIEVFRREQALTLGFEVILVDDGSTDKSYDLSWKWADRSHFPVKVLRLKPREGIGGALQAGFRFAAGRWIVTYDADMSYPLEDIPRLIAAGEAGADIVTASPYRRDAGTEGVDRSRLGISRWATRLYRLRLGRRANDLSCFTCGFRAYRRSALPQWTPRAKGFLATAEMLVRGLRSGLKVAEIPSRLRPRTKGRSKMKVFRTTLAHLRFLVFLR